MDIPCSFRVSARYEVIDVSVAGEGAYCGRVLTSHQFGQTFQGNSALIPSRANTIPGPSHHPDNRGNSILEGVLEEEKRVRKGLVLQMKHVVKL